MHLATHYFSATLHLINSTKISTHYNFRINFVLNKMSNPHLCHEYRDAALKCINDAMG